MRSFPPECCGRRRSPRLGEEAVQLGLGQRVGLGAADHPVGADADLSRDLGRRPPVVARHHVDGDPRAVTGLDRRRDLRARRIEEGDQPEQAQLRLRGVGIGRHVRRVTGGERENAQTASRELLDRRRRRRTQLRRHRLVAAGAVDRRAERKQPFRRPLDGDHQSAVAAAHHAHPLAFRIERVRGDPRSRLDPRLRGGRAQRLLHRVGGPLQLVAVGHHLEQTREVAAALHRIVDAVDGPQPVDRHRVAGERPGLVGADHGRRPERLDGGQLLHQRPSPGEDTHPDGERERDRGEQPLRDVRDQQPDREDRRVGDGEPGEQPEREEQRPDADRDARDEPGRAPDLTLQRAGGGRAAPGQHGDAAQLGRRARREDDGRRIARRAFGPGEHRVGRIDQPVRGVDAAGRSDHRHRLAGQRREIHLDTAVDQPRVRRDPVALRHHEHVAGDQVDRRDCGGGAVAQDARLQRQVARQGLHRSLRLTLLKERHRSVDHDHHDDRPAQHRRAGDVGQHRGHPEQQGERVRELAQDLTRPARTSRDRQRIGSLDRQASRRLPAAEALRARPEVPQEESDRLARRPFLLRRSLLLHRTPLRRQPRPIEPGQRPRPQGLKAHPTGEASAIVQEPTTATDRRTPEWDRCSSTR